MKRELAELIVANAPSLSEMSVREHYSGRAMYGETTCAVYTAGGVDEVLQALFDAGASGEIELAAEEGWIDERMPRFRIDQLSLGVVVY